MRVLRATPKGGNFGDELNTWIWRHLLSEAALKSTALILGIGSILNKDLIQNRDIYVFSSGAGYGRSPQADALNIICVRGQLSALLLGINADLAAADGAILLRAISGLQPLPEAERSGSIFIPHHETINNLAEWNVWQALCLAANIELVSPMLDSKIIVQKIRRSKCVLAEAMHAAIIADTMRVPWIPVVTSPHINTFKWLDWLSVFNLPYQPQFLPNPMLATYREHLFMIKHHRHLFRPKWDLKTRGLSQFIPDKAPLSAAQQAEWQEILSTNSVISPQEALQHQEKTLTRLKALAHSPSFLSDDAIFLSNLAKLKDKLVLLEDILIRTAPQTASQ